MVARVKTVAFMGMEVIDVDVQVQLASGLPEKAATESRERVRAAIGALGLALPPSRITVNLAPADLLKKGSQSSRPPEPGAVQDDEAASGDSRTHFCYGSRRRECIFGI